MGGAVDEAVLEPLVGALRSRGVPADAAAFVRQDVSARLAVARAVWGSTALRRLFLFPGMEEAAFLDPLDAPLEARALAIVAVRNGALEDLVAAQPFAPELAHAGGRIAAQDADALAAASARALQAFEGDGADEAAFAALRTRHPRAFRAVDVLCGAGSPGAPGGAETPGAPLAGRDPLPPPARDDEWEATLSSGVDPRLDATLAAALRSLEEGSLRIFFCDSFPQLTRNAQKLWRVLDRVLAAGAAFVTHNYYLAPDYVARRERLLRPARDGRESVQKFGDGSGLTARHRRALAEVRRGLRPS